MMEIPIDEVVYFDVITSTPSTGAAVDADSTPTFAVYEEATDSDIGIGGNLTKRTSLTGNYRGSFTASAANGFEAGKWYSVIASATVGGVAGKCRALGFRCVTAENTAGVRTVDVTRVNNTSQTAGDLAAMITTVDDYVDTEIAAIKAKTDNLPAAPAAVGDIPTANQNADALLDRSNGIETSYTLRGALRLILSACAGKLSGAATTTNTIRDVGDSKNRIVATVDADGNRSAVTLDAS